MKCRKPISSSQTIAHYPQLKRLPPYALEHLETAFGGDGDAAIRLCSAAPNGFRGLIAYAAFYTNVSNPAYQEIIRFVWNHDYLQLLRDVRHDLEFIRQMMEVAQFDVPLSGTIKVYRGTSTAFRKTPARGLSWTIDRDTACWFALRASLGRHKPIVLEADVQASEIIFWDDDRGEQEVVLRKEFSARVDPHPESWGDAAKRIGDKRNPTEHAPSVSVSAPG